MVSTLLEDGKPFTRLVNIQTGQVEFWNLERMPAYLAVSHTWADNLFRLDVPFAESSGRLAIIRLLESEEHTKIGYCWIDTLCIDQNDNGDKKRQIPLMGKIYGDAEVVAIVVKEHLGLTQAKVDAAAYMVRDAVEMSKRDAWLEKGNQWSSSEGHRGHLKRAMDVLEVFTRPAWGSRVWTMQEFILARSTVWIGGDLQPLKVDEWLFQAIPDVCNQLSIEECLIPRYAKLYSHFQGMACAHLGLIDSTRVMELLGNKIATVPEDEVYGLMSASGVILGDANTVGKENAWARWWEKAVQDGSVRWALLPPASVSNTASRPNLPRNCAMPEFSVRHLCSSNSGLDRVIPYGSVDVHRGTVSITGRMAGRCHITQTLGRIYLDADGKVARDVTLCLFANRNWRLAMRIASAFGAGQYHPKQRAMIAQTLMFNFYRAKLAVMTNRTSSFTPHFRTSTQAEVWSNFMLIQSVHMPVMNEGTAFLAKISNGLVRTDVVVVTASKRPSGDLWAIDFGAINQNKRSMFMIVRASPSDPNKDLAEHGTTSSPPSMHKEGVSLYMQVASSREAARKFASHILEQPERFQQYRMGGAACPICQLPADAKSVDENTRSQNGIEYQNTIDPGLLRYTRIRMLRQDKELMVRRKPNRRRSLSDLPRA